MRKSELINLRWSDINFEKGLATLNETKNGEKRINPVPAVALDELKKFRQIGSGLIFFSPNDIEKPFDFRKQCVQMQGEESIYWGTYDYTVRSMLECYVEELKEHEKMALWFQTEEGWDWLYGDEDRDDSPPVFEPDIVEDLIQMIYSKASDWSNKRIRAYLYRRYID